MLVVSDSFLDYFKKISFFKFWDIFYYSDMLMNFQSLIIYTVKLGYKNIVITNSRLYKSIFSKDAGFVYESLRNETNRVIWRKKISRNESTKRIFQKRIHETNPRYESLRFVVMNPDSRIRILRIR